MHRIHDNHLLSLVKLLSLKFRLGDARLKLSTSNYFRQMLLLRLAMRRFLYGNPEVEFTFLLVSFFLLFSEDEPVECKV